MRYLVLGSEGQIGKYLVKYIRACGDEVIEYDIERDIEEDLRKQSDKFEKALMECDFVFFLAWDVGGSKYLTEQEKTFNFLHNNVSIMKNTFEGIEKYDKPFIFTSSQMAYMAHSVYGTTKLIGEKYTDALGGIKVKLWNVYGPERENIRSHVITDFVMSAKRNGKISVRTNGEERRQFLYVEDCCEALMVLSQKYDSVPRDKDLHISSFEWVSIKKIAEKVSNIYNCSYKLGTLEDNVQMSMQIEPDPYILKLWQPKFSLNKGIKKLIGEVQ